MHTIMVPEQVNTQKSQAGVQVSRLEDKDVIFSTGSTLEVFILFVFILDRNIIHEREQDQRALLLGPRREEEYLLVAAPTGIKASKTA
ncbi:hypothetical protein Tco_0348173 [Tanacetum coccineum]